MIEKLETNPSTSKNSIYRLIGLTDLENSKTSRENFRLLSSSRLKNNPLANTHLVIPSIRYDNPRKSKKIGTLLLISIISICAALTAMVLPLPWSLVTIGFGGPLITLIKRMFRE